MPGEAENLPARAIQLVEGNLGLIVSCHNASPLRGGSDLPVSSPSEGDREKLYASLAKALQNTARQELESPDGSRFAPARVIAVDYETNLALLAPASAAEGDKVRSVVNDMVEKVKALGPLDLPGQLRSWDREVMTEAEALAHAGHREAK